MFTRKYIYLNLNLKSDLKQLSDLDSKANLRQAFRASDKESIVRVVDYGDILNKKSPDQLSIMTYLYHICDHFEPKISKKISKKHNSKTKIKESPPPPPPITAISSNKKKPAPVLSGNFVTSKVSEQNTQKKHNTSYFNPFESDEDETDVNNQVKKQPPTGTTTASGLIQIKSNGEIVDASDNTGSENVNVKLVVQRRNSLNNSSSSSSSSLNSSTPINKV